MTSDEKKFLTLRIRLTAAANTLGGALIVPFGLLLAAGGGVRAWNTGDVRMVLVAAFGALAIWGGSVLLREHRFVRHPGRHRILAQLAAGHASTIVWAHACEGNFDGVRFHFLDGTSEDLNAYRNSQERILRIVAREVPDALIGCGDAQQAEYEIRVNAAFARMPASAFHAR